MRLPPSFRPFSVYFGKMLKEWALWIFLALDAFGLILDIFLPSFSLPQWAFIGFAFVGAVWAGFRVYTKEYARLLELSPELSGGTLKSKLDLHLVEGNEYQYAIDPETSNELVRWYKEEDPSGIGSHWIECEALFSANLRIANPGPANVTILEIEVRVVPSGKLELPFSFHSTKIERYQTDEILVFPIPVARNEILLCKMTAAVKPSIYLNAAQFAARLRPIRFQDSPTGTATIKAEVLHQCGDISEFSLESPVSLVPLKDIFMELWQESERTDLLSLAQSDDLQELGMESQLLSIETNEQQTEPNCHNPETFKPHDETLQGTADNSN